MGHALSLPQYGTMDDEGSQQMIERGAEDASRDEVQEALSRAIEECLCRVPE